MFSAKEVEKKWTAIGRVGPTVVVGRGAPTRSPGQRKLQSVSHTEIHRHAGQNAHRYTEIQSTMHIDTVQHAQAHRHRH